MRNMHLRAKRALNSVAGADMSKNGGMGCPERTNGWYDKGPQKTLMMVPPIFSRVSERRYIYIYYIIYYIYVIYYI